MHPITWRAKPGWPSGEDKEYADWLIQHDVPFTIIFTKCDRDKPGMPSVADNRSELARQLEDKWHRLPSMIPTSSVNKVGRCRLTPGSPRVDRAWSQRLKLSCNELLSSFAFKFRLRRYNTDGRDDVLKFISSIIVFRRRRTAAAKEAARRKKVRVAKAAKPQKHRTRRPSSRDPEPYIPGSQTSYSSGSASNEREWEGRAGSPRPGAKSSKISAQQTLQQELEELRGGEESPYGLPKK